MRNKIPVPGIFLMLTLMLPLGFSAFSQQVALNVQEDEEKPRQKEQKSLDALLGDLEVKFKVNFNYASEVVEDKFVNTKSINKEENLEEILQHLLTPLGLKYEKLKEDLFFILEKEKVNKLRRKDITPGVKSSRPARHRQKVQSPLRTYQALVAAKTEKTITGTVTDENDEPLPGVNILVKNTAIGTISDVEGNYRLNAPDDATTLVFSSVGYLSEEISIAGRSEIDIQMSPDIQQLSEIVVTAFGIEREKDALGYAAQELDAKDLTDTRDVNVANYLAGKVAGVQVSKLASGIGGSSSVIIRGNSSLTGNNQPLYVVDGVPIVNEGMSEGGLYAEHDYGDGIGGINPQDIESISVLKGPNASALYGSRGANGVILITTKSGKKGKKGLGIEVNSSVGMDVINLIPTFQNKFGSGYDDTGVANYGTQEVDGGFYFYPEWGNLDSWGGPLDGSISIIDVYRFPEDDGPTRVMPYVAQPEDNVRDLFYQKGYTNTQNVAITGSNETSSFRLSLGNTDASGVIPNHKIFRRNVGFKANTQVNKNIEINASVNYIRSGGSQRPVLGYSDQNPVYNLAILSRFTPLDFIKEYYERTNSYERFPGMNYNPWYIVNELKNNDVKDRLLGYVSTNIQITDWLSVMGRLSTDVFTEVRDERWPVGARGSDNINGRILQSNRHRRDVNADLIFTANHDLSENLNGTLTAGASYLSQWYNNMLWDGRNFKAEGIYHISNTSDIRNLGNEWEKEIQSVYFSGQLAYKNRLYLDITGRNDWSSTLGENNQSYFYPSVSTSFVFSELLQSGSNNFISFGKVRASWAQVGNDSSPFLTHVGYNLYNTGFNGLPYASKNGTIPPLDLKNELTESWEIGAELRLLNNRIGLDFTYYNARTYNQILSVPVSNSSGYQQATINAGEIQNQGIEAVLNLNPIRFNDFSWNVDFNFAKNNSKIVELAPGITSYTLINTSLNDIEAREGQPYGNIIGYAYKRAPDGQKIVNASGGYVREERVSVLGNITPDWTGGLYNTFTYKGLSLGILIDFVQGGELSSHTKERMTAKGTGKFTLEGRRPKDFDENGNELPYVGVLEGVVEVVDTEGNVVGYEQNTKAVPGQTYWANRAWSQIGEEFVLDASYISLREVMLRYSFKPEFLEKTPFQTLNVSLVGRNLLYLEEHMQDMGISPESAPNTSAAAAGIEALAMPTTRTYTINVNLSF